MENIIITEWDTEKFLSSEIEWQELLHHSDSDPLFSSWKWLSTWWLTFSEPESMGLKLLAAYDTENKLLGLAPLYIHTKPIRFIKSRRLQFIGNCWRGKATMRSELLEFIIINNARISAEEIIRQLLTYIEKKISWDEFILADMPENSLTMKVLRSSPIVSKYFTRIAESYRSFDIVLNGHFEDYLKNLKSSMRRQLYNKRSSFNKKGQVNYRTVDSKEGLELLDQLHQLRWGKPAFQNQRARFNRDVASFFDKAGQLRFSLLTVDDQPVSVQYNYIIGNTLYNILSGFDEKYDRKLPLGYLHFGYEIEYCCLNSIPRYTLLAGEGKNTDYKERLANSTTEIVDFQIVKNILLRAAYTIYSFISLFRK